mmetsp:Transcript_30750/g.42583  ORF Transcript_30750/g.42583 Transcript_30750/m.42583 type:complete len:373 (-) Transcript_30750:140-1258(-)|eukprot:CAMPEP_0196577544 /NCGR_PEP_ID=MMETSP1081-20130531/6600_1 /TAXON_ID=36882 /ORGANISM="Pyramimonas amylifera, Strain CCMP720" /LENGTH=372 /DNA_ID=CAMNT_0041896499 /DNA_START=44 /DNA_END=1162 /DNA_ORIENTATION=+
MPAESNPEQDDCEIKNEEITPFSEYTKSKYPSQVQKRWNDTSSSSDESSPYSPNVPRVAVGTVSPAVSGAISVPGLGSTCQSSAVAPGGGVAGAMSRRMGTTSLARSRELLMVARNAREHLKDKEMLRGKLEKMTEMLETVEVTADAEKSRAEHAELCGRMWEGRARQAEGRVTSAEEQLTQLNVQIKILQLTKQGATDDIVAAQAQTHAAVCDLAAIKKEHADLDKELHRLRDIEEQTSQVAAELQQRCSTLREQLLRSEREASDKDVALQQHMDGVGGEAAEAALLNMDSYLCQALDLTPQGHASQLLEAARGELKTVGDAMMSLMLQLHQRTPPKSSPGAQQSLIYSRQNVSKGKSLVFEHTSPQSLVQ